MMDIPIILRINAWFYIYDLRDIIFTIFSINWYLSKTLMLSDKC